MNFLFCLFVSIALAASQIPPPPSWQTDSNGVILGNNCDFWVNVYNIVAASTQGACSTLCVADPRCTHLFFFNSQCTLKNGNATLADVKGGPSGSVCGKAPSKISRPRAAINCPNTEAAMKALVQAENAASGCIALNPCTYSSFTPCSDPHYNAEFRTKYVCLDGIWTLFGGASPYGNNNCPTTANKPQYTQCMNQSEGLFQDLIFGGSPGPCTVINSCVFREQSVCSSGPNPTNLRDRRYICSNGVWVRAENTLVACGTWPVLTCPSAEGDLQTLIAKAANMSVSAAMNAIVGPLSLPCSVAAQCIYGQNVYTCEGVWKVLQTGPAALLATTESVNEQPAPRKVDELKRRVMGKLNHA